MIAKNIIRILHSTVKNSERKCYPIVGKSKATFILDEQWLAQVFWIDILA